MKIKLNYIPVLFALVLPLLFSCEEKKSDLYGTWVSILIENRSSLFAKTLPATAKGEILLTITDDDKFSWINKKEKLHLTGRYKTSNNKIYFDIEKETKPLAVEFKIQNNKLIIKTDDEFIFTFVKAE